MSEMIVLGRIVAPFGVKGWLKIHAFADDPAAWGALPQWWIGRDAEGSDWKPIKLLEIGNQPKGMVALLDGVADRTAAEAMDGLYVAVPREAMPVPAADEYYWSDLIGLEVVNEAGESLGRVASMIEANANDVIVVRQGEAGSETERLLPFVGQVVKNVNVAAGRMEVAWGLDW